MASDNFSSITLLTNLSTPDCDRYYKLKSLFRPDNDRYYNDRPPMEPLRSRSPYDDDRYGRDSYDDRGSYRRDPYDDRRDPYYDDRGKDPYYDDRRYDEKSDSYNGKPYRDDQGSYRQDSGSYRDKYDDRPPRGPPNYGKWTVFNLHACILSFFALDILQFHS